MNMDAQDGECFPRVTQTRRWPARSQNAQLLIEVVVAAGTSGLAGQTLQRPSPGRIETRYLLREVAERDLPVLLDKPFDLRLRS